MLPLEAAIAVDEPVDLTIEHPPDDVLTHAVSAIDVALFSQVVTDAAGGDFPDERKVRRLQRIDTRSTLESRTGSQTIGDRFASATPSRKIASELDCCIFRDNWRVGDGGVQGAQEIGRSPNIALQDPAQGA
jgi:hypothetical protein